MAVLVTDDFNRSSTTSPGTAATGQAWTARKGTWGTNGSLLSMTAADDDQVTVSCGSVSQRITARTTAGVGIDGAFPSIIARWESVTKFYTLGITTAGKLVITRWSPYADLATTLDGVAADEDDVTFWVREAGGGTTLTAYVNDTLALSIVDTNLARPLTGTSIGFRHGAASPGLPIAWDALSVTDGATGAVSAADCVVHDGTGWINRITRHRIGGAWLPAP